MTSGPDDVIDPSHKVCIHTIHHVFQKMLNTLIQGPVVAYMKKVGDTTTDVGYGEHETPQNVQIGLAIEIV